jgi:hypothetical protein
MRRDLKIANRYKGLTLAEVVLASALLLIVMVPILKALTTAQVSAAIIEQKTRSLILAQAKLDDIKARSIYSFDTNFSENNIALDGDYLCQVVQNSGGSDIKRIAVKVGYDTDSNGSLATEEVQITLVTLLARRY